MSQTVVVNGVNYTIPEEGEEDWGQQVTDYLVALAVIGSLTQSFMNFVNVTSSPTTVVSGRTYLVDTSSARTLTLPAAATNAFFIVRDKTGSAVSNNITIARAGSESIDGSAANKTLSRAFGTWILMCDGTNWYTLNLFPDTGIVNADVKTNAAIAYSKLNLSASIVNADVAVGAAIAYAKLALTSSIVNADIAAAAAIVRSKLASGTANRVAVNDGSGVMTDAAAITAARALISDANGIPAHSAVTSTELALLSGLTALISKVKVGSITSPTSTGNQATTGVGFVPKIVLFYTQYQIAGGVAATCLGAMTSSAQWANGLRHEAGANYPIRATTSKAISTPDNVGAALLEAGYVSMDSDGFTLNFSTVEASARTLFYIAIG